ncbi:aspartyl/asparaginyl beta-hydroxylase domain-containing protein [Streptomyces sp. LX-29]|uniref:aspartyl/asparaginyl beta-hydroxylase domain-containing protein n=1 Tax=Streptomyces sp. LX-29 TaxID=2900152 RepID=UPI00240DE210|nr:aspartyl/asparaginyl beta-hydroxylase domain-containing protein [Streptomyces sp. LX-29]WFB10841.1 aspartyl/asparaginyl beta-hydroxylase domain-containing protein [Streptomyces sp. LX-29]
MTPEIDNAFALVKEEYGADSIERVERMLQPKNERHPMQKGAKWIMPGISQQPWHDPYGHPELEPIIRAFEANHAAIKQEMETAWAEQRGEFSDYEHYLTPQQNWQALYLFRKGALVEASQPTAPTAYKVLKEYAVDTEKLCPLLESHFSTLLPGARIAPHCDLWNFSINLHLAVDIPEDCGITVAGETRTWEEGKCLLFDYSFEHEAWNSDSRPRTALLMDLWHPDTTIPERKALVSLITEIRKLMGES